MNNTNNSFRQNILMIIAGFYVAAVVYVVGELFIEGTTGGVISMTVMYASLFISTSWSLTYIYNVWRSKFKATKVEQTNYRNKYGA